MSAAGLGSPRLHLRRTGSTNERARELAAGGAPHGTLVTASEQSAGRGRQGRRWAAPPGSSLLMSLVLRSPPSLLPLSAALAVCDVAGEQARIKWPNDVVVELGGGALGKLAGILIEGRPQAGWAVLGIGLNVAVRVADLPAELHTTAATLGRSPGEVEPLLGELLSALARRIAARDEDTLAGWRERDALLGREISWNPPSAGHPPSGRHSSGGGQGRAAGIDGLGRLVVALPGGGHTELGAGEVHLESVDPAG